MGFLSCAGIYMGHLPPKLQGCPNVFTINSLVLDKGAGFFNRLTITTFFLEPAGWRMAVLANLDQSCRERPQTQ